MSLLTTRFGQTIKDSQLSLGRAQAGLESSRRNNADPALIEFWEAQVAYAQEFINSHDGHPLRDWSERTPRIHHAIWYNDRKGVPDRKDWIAFLDHALKMKVIASKEMIACRDKDWPNHPTYVNVQAYGLVFMSAWREFEERIRAALGALPAEEYKSTADDPAHVTKAAAIIEQLKEMGERADRFVLRSTSGMTIKPSEDPNAEQVFPPKETGFGAYVMRIDDVRPHGENLSIVTVGGNEVVANRKEDGSFRWVKNEVCVYVPEGALIPEDVLQERGYWDAEKGKGLLEGKKGNRVKMRRFAGHESRGLLFKVGHPGDDWTDDAPEGKPFWLLREGLQPAEDTKYVGIGDEVSDFFGITQHQGG